MASMQYRLVSSLFKLMRVNKMLAKEGPEFEKLLETYRIKQKKPLAVPYKKMSEFDIISKTVEGTTVYVVREKGAEPQKAVLYLFGGGYILPPDPGDIVLCGQIAKETDAEVWFPMYPMAPSRVFFSSQRPISSASFPAQTRPCAISSTASLVMERPSETTVTKVS